jgi:serine-threonine kinase receptor-associated protein
MCTLQHNHIVRAVAFPPNEGHLLATGGMEKKLRIFDLSKVGAISNPTAAPSQKKMVISSDSRADGTADRSLIGAEEGFEVGAGVHKGTIKSIVWTKDPNVLVTACDDKAIRWWNLGTQSVVQEQLVQGDIGSCEFTNILPQQGDIGDGFPVLVIAAGKTVYFYGGQDSRTLIKSINLPYDVASAALHPTQRKFVTGGIKDTWAKVYDYDSEQELGDSSSFYVLEHSTNSRRCTQGSSWSDMEH